jgi:hypothetical protein
MHVRVKKRLIAANSLRAIVLLFAEVRILFAYYALYIRVPIHTGCVKVVRIMKTVSTGLSSNSEKAPRPL